MFACFSFPGQNKQVSFCNKHVYYCVLVSGIKTGHSPFATCMRWSRKSASKSHQTMRRIDPHSDTPYRRILKTRWGMLGDQLFLNVSVSIQYTVHHTFVSVSFTLLIKTFCTPPGRNSVPKPYLISLKVGGIFEVCISKTTALKPNLWRRGSKAGGFWCWEFSREGKQQPVCFFLGGQKKTDE